MTQEAWDYDAFVAAYNAIAEDKGGWHFETDGRGPEVFEQRYLGAPEIYPTIAVFAEGLFIYEQRLNL